MHLEEKKTKKNERERETDGKKATLLRSPTAVQVEEKHVHTNLALKTWPVKRTVRRHTTQEKRTQKRSPLACALLHQLYVTLAVLHTTTAHSIQECYITSTGYGCEKHGNIFTW